MPPLTQRKRLTNEEKLNIIEDSKKPGFCRKKTQVTFSESWGHIRNYSCLLLSKYVRSSSPSFSRNSGSLVIVDIFQLTEQSTITRVHCICSVWWQLKVLFVHGINITICILDIIAYYDQVIF